MEMNKENLGKFREDFAKLNQAIELKYGVAISLGNISFNSESFTTKITVINNENGIEDTDRVKFNSECKYFGFQESDYKRKFTTENSSRVFTLIGFKRANRKYPIIGVSDNGTRYKLPRDIKFI